MTGVRFAKAGKMTAARIFQTDLGDQAPLGRTLPLRIVIGERLGGQSLNSELWVSDSLLFQISRTDTSAGPVAPGGEGLCRRVPPAPGRDR